MIALVRRPMLKEVLAVGGLEVQLPIERITYDEAMLRYGTDRPDRRIGMEIEDLADVFAGPSSRCSPARSAGGGVVRGFARQRRVPAQALRRADRAGPAARREGARSGRCSRPTAGARRSPSSCRDDEMRRGRRARRGGARATRSSSSPTTAEVAATRARCSCGWRSRPRPSRATTSSGSPTSRCSSGTRTSSAGTRCTTRSPPRPATSTATPATWRSRGYDIVMDGTEIGGGSIRINTPEVQRKVFEALGLDAEEAERALRLPARGARATAPRRTAASPSASTGSSRCWPAASRSAT